MSDARRSRIAELRRIKEGAEKTAREADAEIRRLARELADEFSAELAEATGMRGEKRDAFMRGDESIALHLTTESGTVGTQMSTAVAVEPSLGAAIARAKRGEPQWPFQRALDKDGISLTEWAERQRKPRLSVNTAKSWLKKGAGARPPSRFWAERIAKEFPEVPAVDASWPKGVGK